ncbi:MAG: 50S ribosomal protein L29 [Bacteroidota bacterium]
MKASDLRNYTTQELETMIRDNKNLIAELRFSNRVSPIENPARIQKLKRDVARIKTVVNERKREKTAETGESSTSSATETAA